MRLNKYLASCGLGSRRKVEDLIRQGRVKVNGSVVSEPAFDVKSGDLVEFDGRKVEPLKKIYIAFHKPAGVVSEFKKVKGRKSIVDFFPNHKKLIVAGRLDLNSEGLVLLTTDGDWAYRVMHPSFGITKDYKVEIDSPLSDKDVKKLLTGIRIEVPEENEFYTAKAQKVSAFGRKRDRWLVKITMSEGRKREVRRMLKALGKKVYRLLRVRIGKVKLDISRGRWRFLKEDEIRMV